MHMELTCSGDQTNETKNRNKRGEREKREIEREREREGLRTRRAGLHNDERDNHDNHRPGVHRRSSLTTVHLYSESPCRMS
ncbi:hypothetical protein HYC85_011023 [Camellia sinensis]|uniref:Uncharacterized protein n=1 Tax=Camellia sinensis TaxID=4442 RepID=A0A7J7HK41_CAMSI|nr:hypothetical protein HYC85_011023 [Camellia sinensis]